MTVYCPFIMYLGMNFCECESVSIDLTKLRARLIAIHEFRWVIGLNEESSENMDFLS